MLDKSLDMPKDWEKKETAWFQRGTPISWRGKAIFWRGPSVVPAWSPTPKISISVLMIFSVSVSLEEKRWLQIHSSASTMSCQFSMVFMGKTNNTQQWAWTAWCRCFGTGSWCVNWRPKFGDDICQRCSGSSFGCGQVSLSTSRCSIGLYFTCSCQTWVWVFAKRPWAGTGWASCSCSPHLVSSWDYNAAAIGF